MSINTLHEGDDDDDDDNNREIRIPVFYMKFNTGMKKNALKQTVLFLSSTVLLQNNLYFLGTPSNLYHDVLCC